MQNYLVMNSVLNKEEDFVGTDLIHHLSLDFPNETWKMELSCRFKKSQSEVLECVWINRTEINPSDNFSNNIAHKVRSPELVHFDAKIASEDLLKIKELWQSIYAKYFEIFFFVSVNEEFPSSVKFLPI